MTTQPSARIFDSILLLRRRGLIRSCTERRYDRGWSPIQKYQYLPVIWNYADTPSAAVSVAVTSTGPKPPELRDSTAPPPATMALHRRMFTLVHPERTATIQIFPRHSGKFSPLIRIRPRRPLLQVCSITYIIASTSTLD